MTAVDVATYTRRATPDSEPTKIERKLTVTRKVKAAIDAMVWEGLKRADAAAKGQLTDHSLYVALTRPHVKQYYMQQCEVLRLSGRARRIHRLETISEQDDNKQAAVNAIRALDQIPDADQVAGAARATPGVTIIIGQTPSHTPDMRTIDANPLTDKGSRSPSNGDGDE
jgi:hypothetical protein